MGLKYLVTGGAGFIGSHLVEELAARGASVRVLDNFSTGKRENMAACNGHVEILKGDVRDFPSLREALKGVGVVFHQAAVASVQESLKNPQKVYENNVLGTLNVLKASAEQGVRRVVYASSCAVYGNSPASSKKEKTPPSPISLYGESKQINENMAALFSRYFGLETVGLRYFNVFGRRQNPDSPYAGVIPIFIQKLRRDERPVIFGDGRQTRDFICVQDVVRANLLASLKARVGGQVFNVGTGRGTNLNELVAILQQLLRRSVQPRYQKKRAGDIRHSVADTRKIGIRLSFRARCPLREALRLMV